MPMLPRGRGSQTQLRPMWACLHADASGWGCGSVTDFAIENRELNSLRYVWNNGVVDPEIWRRGDSEVCFSYKYGVTSIISSMRRRAIVRVLSANIFTSNVAGTSGRF